MQISQSKVKDMTVPQDQAYTNLRVSQTLVGRRGVFGDVLTTTLAVAGGQPGDVLVNVGEGRAAWSAGAQSIATFNVGVTPNGLALSPDGATLYVANNNNYSTSAGQFVSVVDSLTFTSTKVYSDTFVQPYTVTASADGRWVYITNSASPAAPGGQGTITVLNTTTLTIDGTIDGFDGPSGCAVTRDGTKAYVNNYGATGGLGSGSGHTVSVVDLTTRTIVATVNVDQAPAAVALSPDEAFLYVANYTDGVATHGTVNIIATASHNIIATIGGLFGPFALALSADGTRAYVTNFGSNNFDPFGTTLSVLDLTTNTLLADVDTGGIQPSGVAVSPDGRWVYVSHYNTLYQQGAPDFTGLTAGQGTVVVVDAATLELLPRSTIAVGASPACVIVSPDGRRVYVSNFAGNTVTVLEGWE